MTRNTKPAQKSGKKTRFLLIRIEEDQRLRYSEAATREGYLELAPWARRALDQAADPTKGA